MIKNKQIFITGGAGFIGSALVWKLNKMGMDKIIIVDELGNEDKWKNLNGLNYSDFFNKNDFMGLILQRELPFKLSAIIHLGACSSTREKDADFLMDNNVHYSQELAKWCLEKGVRFIYASSAATYGDGNNGYKDDETKFNELRPLNMYGYSKLLFDLWIKRNSLIDKVVGLKYFNVYGPNEYHKGDMSSVVFKAFNQVLETGKIKLFKSYKTEYKDGEQKRDFVYVKDVIDILWLAMMYQRNSGIYNIGTGKARTFLDLAKAVFKALGKPENIEFIDTPIDIRDKYQYFTEADISKLRALEYEVPFFTLEDAIEDYIQAYLLNGLYY